MTGMDQAKHRRRQDVESWRVRVWRRPGGPPTIRFCCLAALWLSPLFQLERAAAQPNHPLHVSVTVRGVRLSMTVPRQRYPRNALVRVRLTLQNISGRAIALAPPCAGRSPGVIVVTHSSQQVYPPAVVGPLHPTPGCFPTMAHAMLRPGQIRFGAPYAILGGAKVAGTTVLNAPYAAGSFSWPQIQTPFVTEILSRGIAPSITYRVSPRVVVTVHPVGGEQGPLHYTYTIACAGQTSGAIRDSGDRWHTVAGTRVVIPLLPGCLRLTDLAFVAGWVGHPVARLRYHSA